MSNHDRMCIYPNIILSIESEYYLMWLLNINVPALNGAHRLFVPGHSGAAAVKVTNRASLRSISNVGPSRLGHFAVALARLSHGPRLPLSMSHGAGLQSACTFYSGSANARLFENMITNGPLLCVR